MLNNEEAEMDKAKNSLLSEAYGLVDRKQRMSVRIWFGEGGMEGGKGGRENLLVRHIM